MLQETFGDIADDIVKRGAVKSSDSGRALGVDVDFAGSGALRGEEEDLHGLRG